MIVYFQVTVRYSFKLRREFVYYFSAVCKNLGGYLEKQVLQHGFDSAKTEQGLFPMRGKRT